MVTLGGFILVNGCAVRTLELLVSVTITIVTMLVTDRELVKAGSGQTTLVEECISVYIIT